jgi:hypothetical protein
MDTRTRVAVILSLMLSAGLASIAYQRSQPANGGSAPANFQSLHSELKGKLDDYVRYQETLRKGTDHPVIFGAEVSVANANRGAPLLKPQAIKGVILELDRFRELGIQGATITISYPLYTPNFSHYKDYVSFYKKVVHEVRARGMKLDIEAGPIFPSPALPVSYRGLTLEKYGWEKKRMVQSIINDFHPDYLNIGAEPDNDAKLLGLEKLSSPIGYSYYIKYITEGLDKGGTKICSGIGTWLDVSYVKAFVAQPGLDYLDLHFYPVTARALQTAVEAAEIAHRNNKGVIMDEAWLFKMGDSDRIASIGANYDVFKRDVFGFWAPLDQQFLAMIVKLAQQEHIEYISPFWTNYFFAYLDEDSDVRSDMPYQELINAANKGVVRNMIAGKFSSTGEFYRTLIQNSKKSN